MAFSVGDQVTYNGMTGTITRIHNSGDGAANSLDVDWGGGKQTQIAVTMVTKVN